MVAVIVEIQSGVGLDWKLWTIQRIAVTHKRQATGTASHIAAETKSKDIDVLILELVAQRHSVVI